MGSRLPTPWQRLSFQSVLQSALLWPIAQTQVPELPLEFVPAVSRRRSHALPHYRSALAQQLAAIAGQLPDGWVSELLTALHQRQASLLATESQAHPLIPAFSDLQITAIADGSLLLNFGPKSWSIWLQIAAQNIAAEVDHGDPPRADEGTAKRRLRSPPCPLADRLQLSLLALLHHTTAACDRDLRWGLANRGVEDCDRAVIPVPDHLPQSPFPGEALLATLLAAADILAEQGADPHTSLRQGCRIATALDDFRAAYPLRVRGTSETGAIAILAATRYILQLILTGLA